LVKWSPFISLKTIEEFNKTAIIGLPSGRKIIPVDSNIDTINLYNAL